MRRGQSVIDYVIIISIVAVALVAMSRYMGRAVRAHVAKTTDQLGTQAGSLENIQEGTTVLTDYSIMYSEEAGSTRVQEQLGGARTTTEDTTTTSYGYYENITEEDYE